MHEDAFYYLARFFSFLSCHSTQCVCMYGLRCQHLRVDIVQVCGRPLFRRQKKKEEEKKKKPALAVAMIHRGHRKQRKYFGQFNTDCHVGADDSPN